MIRSTMKISAKRLFDIGFSLGVLLLGSPLLLLLAFLVKMTSQGPIFYGSKRVGREGKLFICWKYRTMCLNAEEKLRKALAEDPDLEKEWREKFKLKKDFRVTRVGVFLRKSSLDELPQFWNVLKGDLSVVGPRPVSQEEVPLFTNLQGEVVFSIRPGITGLWQTAGRNDMSYEERIALEKQYVKTRSFGMDLFLILKTIPVMIFSKGAS